MATDIYVSVYLCIYVSMYVPVHRDKHMCPNRYLTLQTLMDLQLIV